MPSPRCPELFQWDLQSRICWQILNNLKHPRTCSAPGGERRHPLSPEECSEQGCAAQDIFKRGQSNCRAFPPAPGRAAKAPAISTAAHQVLLSKPVLAFQHPDIPARFASFFLRRIHGRHKEIALPSFILQAEPESESRQTWGDSAPPSAFL